MSNMSYCRFQNTKLDLEDCENELSECAYELEALKENLSAEEFRAMKRLVELAKTIVEGAEQSGLLDENGEVKS